MHIGISFFVDLLVLCLVIYIGFWAVTKAALPDPWRTILLVALAIIGLIWIAKALGVG